MGDVFRFKAGDRVRVGSEEAEVLDVFPDKDAYRVKIASSGRVMTLQARLVKPFEKQEESGAGADRGVDRGDEGVPPGT
jgi:hypothetical protein